MTQDIAMHQRTSPILHLVINLPHSVQRREAMQEQSDRLGLEVEFVPAVSGKEMEGKAIAGYDSAKRLSGWCAELSPNEQGCIQSHLKTLRRFLESDYEYCIVSEDDCLFADDFRDKTEYLVRRTEGWDYIKLWNEGPHAEILPTELEGFALTFPKKMPWESTCILYNRRGAEKVLKAFDHFWLPFDVQLFVSTCIHRINGCSVYPCPIRLSSLAAGSDIDRDNVRKNTDRMARSPLQWVRYRVHVWRSSWGKSRLKARLMKSLRLK